MCLAFGADALDDVAAKLEEVLELQPPQGLVEKVRGLKKLKSIADSMPKTVGRARHHDVVLTGDDVDLGVLPVQRCWPLDPAPFITLPAVITRDPRTGTRNVGMYRMQVIDGRSTFMHWQTHKDGRMDWLAADGKLEVAVALGLDPVSAYSASAPLPKHIDEFQLAGFLRGEPVELVKGKTVDLEVPANAEIVLEGYVVAGETGIEGPFGDHTGYYSPAEPFPIFHVTAMTMRADAIYPSIVVGKPPAEDAWLGKATERIFLPAIRMTVPEIVDYDLPVAGAFHNCVIVSIRKAFPGHARKVMHAIWGLGMLSLSKSVVVVDEHVDVHDYEDVFFRVCAQRRPQAATSSSPKGPPTSSTTRRRSRATAERSASTRRRRGRPKERGRGPRRSSCRPRCGSSSTAAGTSMRYPGHRPPPPCRMAPAAACDGCYVVDRPERSTFESRREPASDRHPRREAARPVAEPLADRVRDRHRVHASSA